MNSMVSKIVAFFAPKTQKKVIIVNDHVKYTLVRTLKDHYRFCTVTAVDIRNPKVNVFGIYDSKTIFLNNEDGEFFWRIDGGKDAGTIDKLITNSYHRHLQNIAASKIDAIKNKVQAEKNNDYWGSQDRITHLTVEAPE